MANPSKRAYNRHVSGQKILRNGSPPHKHRRLEPASHDFRTNKKVEVKEDVNTEAPIETLITSTETNVGAGGSFAATVQVEVKEDAKSEAPIEVPVVSTETNVGADGSSVTALPEAPDVSKSTEDREKATKSAADRSAGFKEFLGIKDAVKSKSETNVNAGGGSATAPAEAPDASDKSEGNNGANESVDPTSLPLDPSLVGTNALVHSLRATIVDQASRIQLQAEEMRLIRESIRPQDELENLLHIAKNYNADLYSESFTLRRQGAQKDQMLKEKDQEIKKLGIDQKWFKEELMKKCAEKTQMASDLKKLVEAKEKKFEKESDEMAGRLEAM